MQEGERGRGGFRKRRFYSNRERDKDGGHGGRGRDRCLLQRNETKGGGMGEERETKHMVILTKPRPPQTTDTVQTSQQQPTLLLKTRQPHTPNRSPNPPQTRGGGEGVTNAGNPSYQIVTKSPAPPDVGKLLLCEAKMKRSVRLMEGNSVKDHVLNYLTDETDYLVVGCLGPPSIGKSLLLSRLVNHRSKSRKVFDVESNPKVGVKEEAKGRLGSKRTNSGGGKEDKIDVYVTEGRVIFLDSQAICPSLLVNTQARDLKTDAELQSYQYMALLLSVCHIVCCVMDRNTDENLIKLLLRVEVLKPGTPTHAVDSDEVVEYSPTLLLIHNKCEPDDYSSRNLKTLQESYRISFENSKMHIESGLGITNGQVLPTLNPETCQTDPINIFLLPVIETKEELKNVDKYRGHLGYHKLVSKLRQQIFAFEPMSLTYNPLTEKNWYHYVVKIWENIKKNSNLSNYTRQNQCWSVAKERSAYGKT